ncbi:MAG: hypothetical protein QM489_03410 [Candidatus Izemoplasma sp.]
MTLNQKLKRSNQLMISLFLVSLLVFTMLFMDKEHIVSSVTPKDTIGIIISSTVILFIVIFGLFYLPMLFVVKITFRVPSFWISNPKGYIQKLSKRINNKTTPRYKQLCVFRC